MYYFFAVGIGPANKIYYYYYYYYYYIHTNVDMPRALHILLQNLLRFEPLHTPFTRRCDGSFGTPLSSGL